MIVGTDSQSVLIFLPVQGNEPYIFLLSVEMTSYGLKIRISPGACTEVIEVFGMTERESALLRVNSSEGVVRDLDSSRSLY